MINNLKKGETQRFKCPEACLTSTDAVVFGTSIYADQSSICLASVHAGVSNGDDSFIVLAKILGEVSFFTGSKQHNVESSSIDNKSFAFTLEASPEIEQLTCAETSNSHKFNGSLMTKYLVNCPPKCSLQAQIVFGNEVYSGDSSICQAAIHAGQLNDHGGEVQFQLEAGRQYYTSKKAFNIQSSARESFVKSFRFLGKSFKNSIKYTEKFESESIADKYDIFDDVDADNYPSAWEFATNKYNTGSQKHLVIHQSSLIKTPDKLGLPSIICKKDSEIVNFTMKIRVLFVSMSPVGFVFRYKDNFNFYHLRINNVGENKIVLVKTYNTISTVIAQSKIGITERQWYTFEISALYEDFKVKMAIGDLKNSMDLFTVKDDDLQKGSVGLGSNGNNDFYVSQFDVGEYKTSAENNFEPPVLFTNLMKQNGKNSRKHYCMKEFSRNEELFTKCREKHVFYCKLKCDENFSKRMGIVNHACFRVCLDDCKMKEQLANYQKSKQLEKQSSNWNPSEGDACDFKPDIQEKQSYWLECVVTEIEANVEDPEQKRVTVRYSHEGAEKFSTILYPTINLAKCGDKLKRDDCN